MFVRLFVCSFVRLFVCSFVRLFVCSFVRLFVCSFVRLFVCSFVRLFVCSFVRLFVRFARLHVLLVCSFIRDTKDRIAGSERNSTSTSAYPPRDVRLFIVNSYLLGLKFAFTLYWPTRSRPRILNPLVCSLFLPRKRRRGDFFKQHETRPLRNNH